MELASRRFQPQIVSKHPHLKLFQQTATRAANSLVLIAEEVCGRVCNQYFHIQWKWQSNQRLVIHLKVCTPLLFGSCVHTK